MIPRELLGTAPIPGGGDLRLVRRGSEYTIMLGANELMSSRLSGSEEALAGLACGRLAGRRRVRLLIGGLGMGFTLRAALARLDADAKVVVAELVPGVVGWARTALAPLFAGSLDDPRVDLRVADVADVMRPDAEAGFDAILLDVDNGPEGLTLETNEGLYRAGGLAAARRALRPGGVLAVWSAGPVPRFTERLRHAGFTVEETSVPASTRKRGARHVIWLATRPEGAGG